MIALSGCDELAINLDLSVHAPVAQRLEQQTHNLLAVGSNPTGGIPNILIRSPQLYV